MQFQRFIYSLLLLFLPLIAFPGMAPPSKVTLTFNINFESNSAKILYNSKSVMEDIAGNLAQQPANSFIDARSGKSFCSNPQYIVEVVGHTDSKGSYEYNLQLSKKRADEVVRILVEEYGFEKSKFRAIGKGESELLIKNEQIQADYAKNRRVEFTCKRQR